MSWQEEIKTAIRSDKELASYLDRETIETSFNTFIPLSFLERIKNSDVLKKQFFPNEKENAFFQSTGLVDPIGDQKHQKTPNLIHRYSSRALFIPTSFCPIHCRYCFRRNELNENFFSLQDFEQTLEYLREHPEIHEIIFTGGDPLILSNERLEYYFQEFSKIESLKYLRIHTRMPIVLPQRLDKEFITIWKNYSQKFSRMVFVLHVNHKEEFSPEVDESLRKFGHFLTQTVLLKEVNDDSSTLCDLFEHIAKLGGNPYYLHHPDKVAGAMHFYLDIEQGRKIYSELRQKLPGWSIPHYVVDIPSGEGKTLAYNSESFKFSGKLMNKEGNLTNYATPSHFLN